MNDQQPQHATPVPRIVGRYIIMEGSISAHCCFEFSVLDTTKPEIIGGKHFEGLKGKHYEAVCECFDEKSAILICNSLNAPNATITGPQENRIDAEQAVTAAVALLSYDEDTLEYLAAKKVILELRSRLLPDDGSPNAKYQPAGASAHSQAQTNPDARSAASPCWADFQNRK